MALPNVPTKVILFPKNAQVFEIDGLKDQTGAYLNAATMTLTLVDQNGATIIPSTVMTYVNGSQGVYQGQIASSFNQKPGQGCLLIVDSAQGAAIGHWEFIVDVEIRRS